MKLEGERLVLARFRSRAVPGGRLQEWGTGTS